jgi:phosphoribosyl-AMP cyclohydrolase
MNAGDPLGLTDIGTLNFAKGDGLLPAVVQHADTGAVLMVGYMNRDALRETLARRHVVFFSRSKPVGKGRDVRPFSRARSDSYRL